MRGSHMSLSEAKETLGVGDGYTKQQVKSARNSLIKRYHPDVNDDPHAEEILKKINEAYQVLMDSYDAEQEKVRAKQAAEREQKRKAAEQERARRAAQQERANQAAERERARQAEEQKRRNSQEWCERQTSNAGQEWQDGTSQQERQRQAAEEQWRRRTEEARRDRAEQSRRQRERWEAMQREQERQAETQREQERWEAMRREQERQEAKRRDQERKEAQRREQERREAERRDKERERLEQDYLKASEAALYAKTAAEHSRVAELFKALGGYRDSESRCAFHNTIANEKLNTEHVEEAKRQESLRKLNILATLTITAASATNTVLSFISGGILLLILSTLYSGAVILPLSGLLELSIAMRGKMVYGKDGNLGQISTVYAVPLAIVAIVTRSPIWACIATSQLTGGLSYMRNVSKGQSQMPKVILACISLASLVGAFVLLFMD